MAEFDLLNKTELKIDHIYLNNANLTDIAAKTADILGLDPNEILVVDCRDGGLVLDILNNCVNAYKILGKEKSLLESLAALPGVFVSDKTSVRSNGMLGWIALDEAAAVDALEQGQKMVSEIIGNIAKRVIIFSSGSEVANKEIKDTNMPLIKEMLEKEGYKISQGGVLKDDRLFIAANLREAAESGGYGVIITTGGVGAEDKDHTVEAIETLDRQAATPYICHFKVGSGRHVKDGVKIAVGKYNDTMMIALPGPTGEVKASLEPIIEGLRKGAGKTELAEMIASNLRRMLRQKMKHHKGDRHENCQLHIPH